MNHLNPLSESYEDGRPRQLSPLRFSILRLYDYMETLCLFHRELEGQEDMHFLQTVLWSSPPAREALDRKLILPNSLYEETVFATLEAISTSAAKGGWRLDSVTAEEFFATTARLEADYLREKRNVDWRHLRLSVHFESVALQALTGEQHIRPQELKPSISELLTELAELRDALWRNFSTSNFDNYFRAAEEFMELPKHSTGPWQPILGRESEHRLGPEELHDLKNDLEIQMLWKEHTHG